MLLLRGLYLLIRNKIVYFIPFGLLLGLYGIIALKWGEQHLLAQLTGFLLLGFPFLMANLMGSGIDWKAFVATVLFFSAAVFKIKALVTGKAVYRALMLSYLALVVFLYIKMKVKLWLLLPLIENLVVVLYPYESKLKTQGWVELAKGLLYLGFVMAFWK